MAWYLRSGRWRRAEPRYRDRRGPPCVHDQRAALRVIDIVTAVHSHMSELATLEFALQQLARLEDELAPDGAAGRMLKREGRLLFQFLADLPSL